MESPSQELLPAGKVRCESYPLLSKGVLSEIVNDPDLGVDLSPYRCHQVHGTLQGPCWNGSAKILAMRLRPSKKEQQTSAKSNPRVSDEPDLAMISLCLHFSSRPCCALPAQDGPELLEKSVKFGERTGTAS